MADSLPDISVLWIEGPLSRLEQLSVVSMMACGHKVRLFTYAPGLVVPHGVMLADAAEIIPREQLFRSKTVVGTGSWGPFSDIFRFKLLHDLGGVWSDLDLVFLKPIDFLTGRLVLASEHVNPQGRPDQTGRATPTTCFIAAPKADPVIAMCLQQMSARGSELRTWEDSGPGVLQRVIAETGRTDCILNPDILCSVPHWEIDKLIAGFHLIAPNAYGLHFWNELWRWNFLDKNMSYEPLSIYERLKRHYLKLEN
jgi:hypothetical protein